MLVSRDIVRGWAYPSVGNNDDAIEYELCVEMDMEYYQEHEAWGDTYAPITYAEQVDEHYILNGNYVDIDELRVVFGSDCDKYIEEARQNGDY